MAILLLSAYILGDRIFKNLIRSPRPPLACKKSFGFPSSHMVVMTLYCLALWKNCNISQKIFLIFLVIIQAFARVELHYHYWDQVFGGIIFAFIYFLIFQKYLYLIISRLYSMVSKSRFYARFCQYFRIV